MNIKANNIKKDYLRNKKNKNVFTALFETDAEFSSGELSVIFGRSGSGKSTLLNILSGILKPECGSVFYDDIDIYKMGDKELSLFRNQNIGFIPQGKSAVSSLSVIENVLLPKSLYKTPTEDDKNDAIDLLEKLRIVDLKDEYPKELSGGELRRMAIARALINKPKVLFSDEPTGDLDDENTRIVLSTLKELKKSDVAVILVTHEKMAKDFSDKIYKMDAGVLSPA